MKHIITFSGGKDSLATLIWAKNNLPEFEVIFCDTGWEAEATYAHIAEVEQWFDLKIKVLTMRNKDGQPFQEMVKKKGRAPSTKARFCTEELKVKPSIDYILSLTDDVTVYQGIRAESSAFAMATRRPFRCRLFTRPRAMGKEMRSFMPATSFLLIPNA